MQTQIQDIHICDIWGKMYWSKVSFLLHNELAHLCNTIWIIWDKVFKKYMYAQKHVATVHRDLTR